MTQKIVALLGISGVGKTTFLRGLSKHLAFQHLQASALIRTERERLEKMRLEGRELRDFDIGDNQQLLLRGFHKEKDAQANLIVLDGHSVIDTGKDIVRVAPGVFKGMGVEELLFLADDPLEIFQRRQKDSTRRRTMREAAELAYQQDVALGHGMLIAQNLAIPMIVVGSTHVEYVAHLLKK